MCEGVSRVPADHVFMVNRCLIHGFKSTTQLLVNLPSTPEADDYREYLSVWLTSIQSYIKENIVPGGKGGGHTLGAKEWVPPLPHKCCRNLLSTT